MSDATLSCDNTRAYSIGDAQPQHPAAVGNGRGLLSHMRRGQCKKRVPLRVGSWNIGTMTARGAELADTLRRRRVNIACLQETKWKGAKAKKISEGYTVYILFYCGRDGKRNGVGIVVDNDLKNNVVIVNRVNDRLILVKLSIGELVVNIISAYAPQVGVDAGMKRYLLEQTLTGMWEKNNAGYERVHGGKRYGNRNFEGECVLQIATAYDLVAVNTYFDKCEERLITYKSVDHKRQIDYLLTRRTNLKRIKDCKVIPGEDLTSQHRFLVMELKMDLNRIKCKDKLIPKIKWWLLKGERAIEFKEKMNGGPKWPGKYEGLRRNFWEKQSQLGNREGDDIVLIDEGREELQRRLNKWQDVLENEGLKISQTKTEYMFCNFDGLPGTVTLKLNGIPLPESTEFRYLGSLLQNDSNIDRKVTRRINAGWLKWKSVTGITCNKRMPLKIRELIYKTVIRSVLMYECECWPMTVTEEKRLHVAEM
ncbi:uncharacterized protein [Centruroides vittatus]|uniref:uncharacterized protein n=1 Tax=Centruroides vittatus TaxID=120091 RepID=UPI00350F1462